MKPTAQVFRNIAADRKIASFQNANADQIVNITGTGICFEPIKM